MRSTLVIPLVLGFATAHGHVSAQDAPKPPEGANPAQRSEPAREEPASVRRPELSELASAEYPAEALAEGRAGTVVLRLTVASDGSVSAADVIESAGPDLDEAARAALLRSRFTPASKDGRSVAARIAFRYDFRLPAQPADSKPPETSAALVPTSTVIAVSEAARPAAPIEIAVHGELSQAEKLQRSAMPVTVVNLHRQKRRASDLGEIMARTHGAAVRRSGGLGSDTRFSLNGLQEDQLRLFLNGVPLDHGFPFGVANIPVNLLERIEIYRGVVPVRYASDALGGAVNFVTDRDFDTRVRGSYQVGSFGTHRATLLARHRFDSTGIVLGLESYFDAAENDYEVSVEVPDERGRPEPRRVRRFHDRYRAHGVALDAGVTDVPWARRLVLRGLMSGYTKELQSNLVMSVPYGEVRYGETLSGVEARYEHAIAPRVQVELLGSYGYRTIDFVDKAEWVYDWYGRRIRRRLVRGEIEAKPSDQSIHQHGAFARGGLQFQPATGHALRVATSSDYTDRTGDERIQLDPRARDPLTAERRLFKQISGVEYELGLSPRERRRARSSGTRVEHAFENVLFAKSYLYDVDSEEPLPGGVFVRRNQQRHRFGIGDGVRLILTDCLYAKASYELAARLPRTDEVFGNGVLVHANLELEPEISDNGNLGARLELEDSPVGDVTLDVNAFFRDTRQQIVLLGNDRYFTYDNVYSARSVGLEGSFEWTLLRRALAFDGSFTWIEQRNTSTEGTFADFEGDRIPNRPWLTASLGARYRFRRVIDAGDELEPFYTARYVHDYFRGWESVGLREFKQVIPSQLVHGAGFTYLVRRPFTTVSSTFEVQNLTDTRAFDFYGQERPGRAFHLKLTAEL